MVIEREQGRQRCCRWRAEKVDDETERIAAHQEPASTAPRWLDGALRAAGVIKEGETL